MLSGALAGRGGRRRPAVRRAAARRVRRRAAPPAAPPPAAHRSGRALTARPWVVDAAMRAARDHQPVFDGFVDLGLGDGLLTARTLARIATRIR